MYVYNRFLVFVTIVLYNKTGPFFACSFLNALNGVDGIVGSIKCNKESNGPMVWNRRNAQTAVAVQCAAWVMGLSGGALADVWGQAKAVAQMLSRIRENLTVGICTNKLKAEEQII